MPQTMTRPGRQQGQAQAQPMVAFRTAVQTHDETVVDQNYTLSASTVDVAPLQVPASGFIQQAWYLFEATASGNSATVAFKEDGPFSVIDTVALEDVNQAPIFGPLSGHDWYLINKYGGYAHVEDPKWSPIYSVTTGSGGSGGSFTFALMIPIEIVNRDALGPLANKSGTAQYKIRVRLAPLTSVYSTAPTAAPTIRVRGVTESYWDPETTDLKGRPVAQQPPALGTTQFWTKQNPDFTAGQFRKSSERTGYAIRNFIFALRASDGLRATAETLWPDPLSIQVDATIMRTRLRKLWRHQMSRDYGETGSTGDAAGAFANGVYVEAFCKDFGLKPGAETRRGYLETSSATRLDVYGTTTGSGTQVLTWLTNDIAPIRDYAELVSK